MKRQKSFETDGGVLYVVGTPIGNLGDLSVRTKQILGEVDLIACRGYRHRESSCLIWGFQLR